jgi:prepilin-type processing-associated H-X9-DG protein
LNTYAKNVLIFHCPADKGDAFNLPGPPSCWDAYGNSYLIEWSVDRFAVEKVTGDNGVKSGAPVEGNRDNRIGKKTSTKIIQGDWPWHPNRPVGDTRSAWHNYQGQRRCNMLYADGHIAYSKMPDVMDVTQPVDLNFTWW